MGAGRARRRRPARSCRYAKAMPGQTSLRSSSSLRAARSLSAVFTFTAKLLRAACGGPEPGRVDAARDRVVVAPAAVVAVGCEAARCGSGRRAARATRAHRRPPRRARPPAARPPRTFRCCDLRADAPGQDLLHQRHVAGPQGHGGPRIVGRRGHQHHAAAADRLLDHQRIAAGQASTTLAAELPAASSLKYFDDGRGQQARLARGRETPATIGWR